jgi:hypothetical protein
MDRTLLTHGKKALPYETAYQDFLSSSLRLRKSPCPQTMFEPLLRNQAISSREVINFPPVNAIGYWKCVAWELVECAGINDLY